MKARNFLLFVFVGMMLCISSPAFADTLFFDDFENASLGVSTHFATDVTANPGTWAVSGNGVYDFRFAASVLGISSVDSGGYYGSTLMGNYGTEDTYLDATFTSQGNAADLIILEADCHSYKNNADLELCIMSGGTACNSVILGGGATDGSVLINGSDLGMTAYSLGAWHHVTMEYYPGASTFDLTIDSQTITGIAMTTTPTSVDAFRLHGTDGEWACFDNVSVTSVVSPVPEPSTVALLTCGLLGLMACVWRKRK